MEATLYVHFVSVACISSTKRHQFLAGARPSGLVFSLFQYDIHFLTLSDDLSLLRGLTNDHSWHHYKSPLLRSLLTLHARGRPEAIKWPRLREPGQTSLAH